MLTYQASPKQLEFGRRAFDWVVDDNGNLTNRYKVIGFGGGIRSGKTYAGLATLVLFAHAFPGSRWAVVRQSIEIMKVNTIPVFYKIFPPDMLAKPPSASNNWIARFKNGSEIIFWSENFSADRELTRWRGLEVNGFLLEEANELDHISFLKALERLGTWRMEHKWKQPGGMVYPKVILFTTNPASNWIKSEYYDKWRDGTLQDDFTFIPATLTDNDVIMREQPGIIEEKRRILPDYLFQKFIEGDWDVSENDRPFITEFSDRAHVWDISSPANLQMDWREPLYVSMDFNIDPPAALICQHGKGFLNVFEEVNIGAGSIYDVCRYIKRNYEGYRIRLTGDASGRAREKADKDMRNLYQISCNELGLSDRFDVDAPTANMRIDMSRDLCNAVFRGHLFGYHLRIDQTCKKLLADVRRARVNRFGELEKSRTKEETFMDYLDALRYMIATAVPEFISNPARYL